MPSRIDRLLVPELRYLKTAEEQSLAYKKALSRFHGRAWLAILLGLMFFTSTILREVAALPVRWLMTTISLTVTFSLAAIGLPIFRSKLRKALRQELTQAHQIPICIDCGYDLRGQTAPKCPECGTPFDARLLQKQNQPSVTTESRNAH